MGFLKKITGGITGGFKKAASSLSGKVKSIGKLVNKATDAIQKNPIFSTALSFIPGATVATMVSKVATSGFVDKAKVAETLVKHGQPSDKKTVEMVSRSLQQGVKSETGLDIGFVDANNDGIDDRLQTNQNSNSGTMDKLKEFWTKYKTPIIIVTVVGIVIAVGVWMYKRNKRR